ncbi:MAG: helix-turn-helix domain-containing protein [Bdellovibrionales bacterium]|nr:helix-turn-helix domain-containing protein [Bdellovibrionales bacterium]
MKSSSEKLNKSLARLLRQSREQQYLTQRQVSDRLGLLSPQFISNIERGVCAPSPKILKRLIVIYKLDRSEVSSILLEMSRFKIQKILNPANR